jgi:hypothetical protein
MLTVPLSASYVEIYGQDREGELLLAVFPLTDVAASEANQVWSITCEAGQTLELTVLSDQADIEEAEDCRVQITYLEAPLPFPARMRQLLQSRWAEVNTVLQWFYIPARAPAVSTALILILCISTTWLGVLHFTQPEQVVQPPEQRRGGLSVIRFQLAFRSDSSVRAIQQLLQEIQGRIADGPTLDGIYSIEVPLHPSGVASRDALKDILEQRRNLVRFYNIPDSPTPGRGAN